MVTIDYERYDRISEMEDVVKSIMSTIGLQKAYITMKTYEQQITYMLTMISILYKEKCYEEYLESNVNGELDDVAVDVIYDTIDSLKECIIKNNNIKAIKIIKERAFIIEPFLQRYFSKKQQNYIAGKHSMEIVINQNNQVELLQYNPFAINQVLKYQQQPLAKEEINIKEITEFLVDSQQIYEKISEMLKNVKKMMINNYKNDHLNEVIAFIISNAYQEVKEHTENENHNTITAIVENSKINVENIIKHFKDSDTFSNMILNTFLEYNLEIEKGRLQELSTKPSKEYAKRIYQK